MNKARETSFNIQGIACGIFKEEIEYLIEKGKIKIPYDYIDSSLHIFPGKLKEALDKKINFYREKGKKLLLVYGECHAYMNDIDNEKDIYRTKGVNCINIILGIDRFRELRRSGAFIFMPEWTARWKEVFSKHLGLKGDLAKEMLQDTHKKLVFIESVDKIDEKIKKEIKEYFDMETEIEKVKLDNLLDAINIGVNYLKDA